jgi:hypothetical protein
MAEAEIAQLLILFQMELFFVIIMTVYTEIITDYIPVIIYEICETQLGRIVPFHMAVLACIERLCRDMTGFVCQSPESTLNVTGQTIHICFMDFMTGQAVFCEIHPGMEFVVCKGIICIVLMAVIAEIPGNDTCIPGLKFYCFGVMATLHMTSPAIIEGGSYGVDGLVTASLVMTHEAVRAVLVLKVTFGTIII